MCDQNLGDLGFKYTFSVDDPCDLFKMIPDLSFISWPLQFGDKKHLPLAVQDRTLFHFFSGVGFWAEKESCGDGNRMQRNVRLHFTPPSNMGKKNGVKRQIPSPA